MAKGGGNVGATGEARFQELCAREGLISNRVQQDATGWDFLVEFPAEPGRGACPLPADLRPPAACCKVQVKTVSHSRTRRTCGVRLANWSRLVRDPLPAFFLVVELDAAGGANTCALIHVDELICARVLRRLRIDGRLAGTAASRGTLELKWDATHRFGGADSRQLRERISSHIGSNPLTYFQKKQVWNERCGYAAGEPTHRFTAQLDLGNAPPWGMLVDFALGLQEQLPATFTEFVDLRFGVPATLAAWERRDGALAITHLPGIEGVTLRFESLDGLRRAEVGTTLYVPQRLFPFIPDGFSRLRYRNPWIDLVVEQSESARANFKIKIPNEPTSLSDLHSIAQAMDIALNSPGGAFRTFTRLPDGETFGSECAGSMGTSEQARTIANLAAAVSAAFSFVQRAGLSVGLAVSPGEILEQAPHLDLVGRMLSGSSRGMKLRYYVATDVTGIVQVGLPIVVPLKLAGRRFLVAGTACGEARLDDEADVEGFRSLLASDPVVELTGITEMAPGADAASRWRELQGALVAALEGRGIPIVLGGRVA